MYDHGQKSWDTFAFLGRFPRILICPTPPLTPQTTLDACIQNFSECQLCLGWREGELKENVGKDALFYEVTQKLQKIMNTAFLSQGLLSMIVVVVTDIKFSLFFFLGIGDRLLWQRSQRWDIKFLGYWCGAGISVQVLLLSHGKTAFRDSKRILATTRL